MKIIITSDHAGFALCKALYAHLKAGGYEVTDVGPYALEPKDDYPDYIAPVALEVSHDPDNTRAIIIGGSGQGEAIMANRFPRVRAVVFNGQYAPHGRETPDEILYSRLHNDSNVLSLGARFINETEAKVAVEKWLSTPFSNEERHVRRIRKIEQYAPQSPLSDARDSEGSRTSSVHDF